MHKCGEKEKLKQQEDVCDTRWYHLLPGSPVPRALSTATTVTRLGSPSRNSPRYICTQVCLYKCVALFFFPTKWQPTMHIVGVFLFHIAQRVKIGEGYYYICLYYFVLYATKGIIQACQGHFHLKNHKSVTYVFFQMLKNRTRRERACSTPYPSKY